MSSNCLFASWNIRGLGKAEKKASVRRLIKSSKARVVFIQETKLRTCEDKLIRSLCGLSSSYKFAYSPSVGSAGGLITLWDPAFFTLETSTIEQRFISITGMIHTFNLKCMLINIYAPNDFHCRQEFFGSISSLAASSNLPILLGGDFNIVRNAEEKVGMVTQWGAMKAFSDFIDDLSLIDLPLHGGKFTWSNLRDIPSTSRIDRYLLSHEIAIAWPSLIQQVLPRGISDHNPISLSISAAQWGPKPFKWFDHWAENQQFSKIIRASCGVSKGQGIMSVLRKCKSISKDWVADNRNKDPDSIQAIERKCNKIEIEIANGVEVSGKPAELRVLRAKLWKCLRIEEREWLQKSRLRWFEAGDKNTKYFHLVASSRRRNNHIESIKVNETVVQSPVLVKKVMEDHFKSIYNSSDTYPVARLDCDIKSLKPDSANNIEKPFSSEEIWSALSAMDGSRAPGPDGFNMTFLKRFWEELKDDILSFFELFFNGQLSDKSFNHSFIVLIPKTKSPISMEDYRPISLVSFVYKLLAKVLAFRLSSVSEEIIGETQFAFSPGKQILDCVLIANEVVDYTKKRGLQGIVFKADFRKAYDFVDWNFLLFVMERMGFGKKWCSWIKLCISIVFISVLVNGSPTNPFNISHGMRQGCPLSPLLFNIIAEALSSLFRKAASLGLFSSIRIGNSSAGLSHLQFADDLIVFCGASETEIKNVVRLLRGFEVASGLKLNLKKSKLLGINVDAAVIDNWAEKIFCKSEKFPSTYLGLPLGISKNDAHVWDPVVEKVRLKLSGWKSKTLSFGGRITLVKSVLSNLPIYFISILPMPVKICKLLSNIIAKFLWGSSDHRAIHWLKWETICLPRSHGGLGLINFKVKNHAMLFKWIWRYGSEPNSLWRKIIADRYESSPNTILPTNVKSLNKSFIWRNISAINDLINNPSHFADFAVEQETISKDTWCPPLLGELKFNVDGATLGSFGETGIGGCLRDVDSNCLITFSKSVGVTDCTSAELLAIKEACLLFRNSTWARKFKLIIETDSTLATRWMTLPSSCAGIFKPLIDSYLKLCEGLDWSISHIPRARNSLADNLAKKGIARTNDIVVWRRCDCCLQVKIGEDVDQIFN
ncbi:hypothetical protein GQ457_09G028800 [Hibiscus cannabinus]